MTNLFKKAEKGTSRDLFGHILSVSVEKIIPNPRQPRKSFDPVALEALTESIRQHGILQPIAIRRIVQVSECKIASLGDEGGEISLLSEAVNLPQRLLTRTTQIRPIYEIVSGERRFRAAQAAGLREVPCLLYACDESESAELAIIENIQRQDLNPFEEAAAIAGLLDMQTLTQEEIAKRLSVSQSYIANKLRLLRLGKEERALILSHRLTERHARALLKLENEELRLAVLHEIISRGLNVSQTEALVRVKTQTEKAAVRMATQTRKMAVKDIRIFYNTIEHAVETIAQAGIDVSHEKRETTDAVEYIIRLPKAAVSEKA